MKQQPNRINGNLPACIYYYPRCLHTQHLKIDINNQGQDIKDIRRVGNWNLGVTEQKYTKKNYKATATATTINIKTMTTSTMTTTRIESTNTNT